MTGVDEYDWNSPEFEGISGNFKPNSHKFRKTRINDRAHYVFTLSGFVAARPI